MGSVPGTITFSCQSATSISDAALLLYAVFIDLNRFRLSRLCVFMIVSSYFLYAYSVVHFTFGTIAILTALNSVACSLVRRFSINALIQGSVAMLRARVRVCRLGSSSLDSITDQDSVAAAAAAAAAQQLHLQRLAAAMRYSPYHLTPHPCLPLPGPCLSSYSAPPHPVRSC